MLLEGVPILRIQNLNGGENWFYSDLDLANDKYCEKGDLLYAWSATFGPYWAKWDKAIYHYHIWKIEPSEAINKRFAFYELWHITVDLKASSRGVAMPHITKTGMEKWKIIIPPLNEQIRIANKLDLLLAKVEAAQTRLDKIPTLLKCFRQAVLAAATFGELTKEWRGHNSDNFNFPKDLIINNYDGHELDDLPVGWAWVSFCNAASIKSNLVDPKLGRWKLIIAQLKIYNI